MMERGEVGQEGTEGGWFFSVMDQPGWIKPVSNTTQLLLFPTVPRLDCPHEAPSACRKDRQDEVTEQRYQLFKVHGPQAHLIP